MTELAQAIRDALQTLNLDVHAAVLDRAAVVVAMEIEIAARLPRVMTVTGAEWVTVKALADAESETVGAVARGIDVLVGAEEAGWRPLYGFPLGWLKGNLLQEV